MEKLRRDGDVAEDIGGKGKRWWMGLGRSESTYYTLVKF